MPRPKKCRRIGVSTARCCFKPIGIPANQLKEIILSLDELEAIRLADYQGMYQEQSAREMNISRQTFGNILNAAHKKIADALLNGQLLKIEGGNVLRHGRRRCGSCQQEWPETEIRSECPSCHVKIKQDGLQK